MTEEEVEDLEEALFEDYFFNGEPADEWQVVKKYLVERLEYQEFM